MAVFDMVTNAPWDIIKQGSDINDHYFTVDTADREIIHQWLHHNRRIATYAIYNGVVPGFFNAMPMTTECGELFERHAIKEEDLRIDHLLPHEALPHAQYSYIGAIAVKDTESYLGRQCTAALVGCMADLFLNGYTKSLRKIFANPTTFQGNKIVRRLGLKPLTGFKKGLTGNDIYVAEMNEETLDVLRNLSQRYGRFIGRNDWAIG